MIIYTVRICMILLITCNIYIIIFNHICILHVWIVKWPFGIIMSNRTLSSFLDSPIFPWIPPRTKSEYVDALPRHPTALYPQYLGISNKYAKSMLGISTNKENTHIHNISWRVICIDKELQNKFQWRSQQWCWWYYLQKKGRLKRL